jgi:hypothetical protein
MKRFCVALACLLSPVLAMADGRVAEAERRGCGGDAYSFAEVISAPRPEGPYIAAPDTLCADLAERGATGINSLHIYLDQGAGSDARPSDPARAGMRPPFRPRR